MITFKTLQQSLYKVSSTVHGLKMCGIEVEKMSSFITYDVASKLPERLKTDLENSVTDNTKYPHFNSLASLLTYGQSKIHSNLVCAKNCIAPLKTLTILQIELLGAILLAKLAERMCKTLNYDIRNITAFCNLTILLPWLKSLSSKYQVFVRNPIHYIISVLSSERWQYVPTLENPADLITHRISATTLTNNTLWLHSLTWLYSETLPLIEFL